VNPAGADCNPRPIFCGSGNNDRSVIGFVLFTELGSRPAIAEAGAEVTIIGCNIVVDAVADPVLLTGKLDV
jgi:hypothetical protein